MSDVVDSAPRFLREDLACQRSQGRGGKTFCPGLRGLCVMGFLGFLGIYTFPNTKVSPEVASRETLMGYKGVVRALEFSPGGEVLASVGLDGVARLWDVTNASEIEHRGLNAGGVFSVAFSPDGKTLAAGGKGEITFWNVTEDDEVEGRWHSGLVTRLRYSRDGKSLLTVDDKGLIRRWDVDRLSVLSEIETHQAGHIRMEFVPGGIRWASRNSDLRARVCKAGADGIPACHLLPGERYFAIAFSPDASVLFAGSQFGYIQVQKQGDEGPGRRIEVYGHITTLAPSPDGRLLAYGLENGAVGLVEVKASRIMRSWREHTLGVSALAFSPDGRLLASGSKDSVIKIWDVPGSASGPVSVASRSGR